jgi:hypothetical protein
MCSTAIAPICSAATKPASPHVIGQPVGIDGSPLALKAESVFLIVGGNHPDRAATEPPERRETHRDRLPCRASRQMLIVDHAFRTARAGE